MYYSLATLTGFLIALMLVVNGRLTDSYGAYLASVIIHVVGLVCVLAVYLFKREPLRPKNKLPFYYFLGGALGVGTTVFNNLAFGVISVSAITALGLLGQSVASVVIDHYGLLGMPKRRFNKTKLVGFAFLLGGILLMLVW